MRPYLEKLFTKIGLVEWFKVKALSSSPSPAKKKKKKDFPHPPAQSHIWHWRKEEYCGVEWWEDMLRFQPRSL
jgi:hypothetical protein